MSDLDIARAALATTQASVSDCEISEISEKRFPEGPGGHHG